MAACRTRIEQDLVLSAAGARKPGGNLQAEQLSSVSAAKGCGFLLRGNGRFAKHLKICILEIFFSYFPSYRKKVRGSWVY